MLFYKQCNPHLEQGVHNFFLNFAVSKKHHENDHIIVNHVLLMNSYWAHPEHLLLAAVYDDDIEARRVVVERNITCRRDY